MRFLITLSFDMFGSRTPSEFRRLRFEATSDEKAHSLNAALPRRRPYFLALAPDRAGAARLDRRDGGGQPGRRSKPRTHSAATTAASETRFTAAATCFGEALQANGIDTSQPPTEALAHLVESAAAKYAGNSRGQVASALG